MGMILDIRSIILKNNICQWPWKPLRAVIRNDRPSKKQKRIFDKQLTSSSSRHILVLASRWFLAALVITQKRSESDEYLISSHKINKNTMKQLNAKKYIHDGVLIYKSDTLHHTRSCVRGYLFKQSSDKFFKRSSHYKRFLTIDSNSLFIQKDDKPCQNATQIKSIDLICLQKVAVNEFNINGLPWNYSFELKTSTRLYKFYAPSSEERDLWLNGLHRLLSVPVNDSNFRPMQKMSKEQLRLHEEVMQTEGNGEDRHHFKSIGMRSNREQTQKPQGKTRQLQTESKRSSSQTQNAKADANETKTATQVQSSSRPKQRMDELKTFSLVDQLDEQSKSVLNQLVMSVIKTQKENDNDRIQLIKHHKQLIQAEKRLEAERMAYEKQRMEIMNLKEAQSSAEVRIQDHLKQLQIIHEEIRQEELICQQMEQQTPSSKKKKRIVSVRRYKVNADGSKTLVSTCTPSTTKNVSRNQICFPTSNKSSQISSKPMLSMDDCQRPLNLMQTKRGSIIRTAKSGDKTPKKTRVIVRHIQKSRTRPETPKKLDDFSCMPGKLNETMNVVNKTNGKLVFGENNFGTGFEDFLKKSVQKKRQQMIIDGCEPSGFLQRIKSDANQNKNV